MMMLIDAARTGGEELVALLVPFTDRDFVRENEGEEECVRRWKPQLSFALPSSGAFYNLCGLP
jgi:hypothetical protein